MRRNFFIALVGVYWMLLSFPGCSGEGDSATDQNTPAADSSGDLQLVMAGTNFRGSAESALQDCKVSLEGNTISGKCMTPFSVRGYVASLFLSSQYDGSSSAARLIDFGGGSKISTGSNGGLTLRGFDLSASRVAEASEESENTLPDAADPIYFDRVSAVIASLDIKIEIPAANLNVENRFWTIRFIFIPQPLLSERVIDTCVTDTTQRQNLEENGNLFSSPQTIHRGDILICMKSSSGDVCQDSDFLWIDRNNGLLKNTRPGNPVGLTGNYALMDLDCSTGTNAVPDLNLGGMVLSGELTSAMTFTKTLASSDTDGKNSADYTYTATENCTALSATEGNCLGTPTSGERAVATVLFDMENFVFIEDSVDLESDSQLYILMNLARIMPKPIYVENYKSQQGAVLNHYFSAEIAVALE